MRLKSKNSEIGRRLANRDPRDWELMLLNRSPNRDVIASMGMCIELIVADRRK